MFKTVLHANDGSDPAFRALALAINMAQQNAASLHLVCIEEIPPMPEYIEEIREAKGMATKVPEHLAAKAAAFLSWSRAELSCATPASAPIL